MSTISKNSCNILKRLPRTVRDSNIIPNGEWELYSFAKGGYCIDIYKIYVCIDNDGSVYMKPYTPYLSFEFEQLFNFGTNCKNYDENKIIVVTEKNFNTQFD